MSSISFVYFDAVGTLMRPEPSPAAIYAEIGARFGLALPIETVGARFRRAFRRQEQFDGRDGRWATSPERERDRWRRIVHEVFTGGDDDAPAGEPTPETEAAFVALWDHFARPDAWAMYEDAVQAIRALDARGRPWGIASNFDARLRSVVAGRPELRGCRVVVTSAEVGYRKPGAGFFRAAEALAGVSGSQLLLVGDDEENDRAGGSAAGWQTRLINRAAGDRIDAALADESFDGATR
ncbi:MAG TPA: HAD family hydrolase [Pirellulales bacterium]